MLGKARWKVDEWVDVVLNVQRDTTPAGRKYEFIQEACAGAGRFLQLVSLGIVGIGRDRTGLKNPNSSHRSSHLTIFFLEDADYLLVHSSEKLCTLPIAGESSMRRKIEGGVNTHFRS